MIMKKWELVNGPVGEETDPNNNVNSHDELGDNDDKAFANIDGMAEYNGEENDVHQRVKKKDVMTLMPMAKKPISQMVCNFLCILFPFYSSIIHC
jgi:hypothetical protein